MKTGLYFCLTILVILLAGSMIAAQESYKWDKDKLILDNGFIKRQLIIDRKTNGIFTDQLYLNGFEKNFLSWKSPEFAFRINDKHYDSSKGWEFVSGTPASDNGQGNGLVVKLRGSGPVKNLEITITYMVYPNLPVIRKYIIFRNMGAVSYKLEALNIEQLSLSLRYVESWVYSSYARMKSAGSYLGNWDDALVIVHHPGSHSGIALGNEVPGVIKRTAYKSDQATIGLTRPDQEYPFRKWLRPGETWTSPKTFIALYNQTDNGMDAANVVVNEFARRHLGFRFNSLASKPTFIYNTWYPFRAGISDSLMRVVARSAAECGVQTFVMDDGWQVNFDAGNAKPQKGYTYGDWLVDRKKFPGGLKTTCNYIRSLGMKPGLWITLGSATSDARVFKEHPEWMVRDKNGKSGNLYSHDTTFHTACFGTDWYGYIKKSLVGLVKDYGLAYIKLDFSIATSPYVNETEKSGCYSTGHPYHRDRQESFIVIYERAMKLFDEIHREVPDVFIDCTYEVTGKMYFQDYASAQHADGNWLSNIEDASPTGSLRARHLAWWRSPAMPAGSLVIGNLPFDSKNFELDLKSLIGTLPIVLGDPTKLSAEEKASIKKWSDWLLKMQAEYNYQPFRQDLPGFGEPAEGSWDGWARINTETRLGGIVGVFRQGAAETTRTVAINGLDCKSMYAIKRSPDQTEIARMSGADLLKKGFPVKSDKNFDGQIFEIEQINQ